MAGKSVARIVGCELERIAACDPRYFELQSPMRRLVDVLAERLSLTVPDAIEAAIQGAREGRSGVAGEPAS